MDLRLGNSQKLKIIIDGVTYSINLFSALPTIEEVILSSSDDCLLKDFNGLYLSSLETK